MGDDLVRIRAGDRDDRFHERGWVFRNYPQAIARLVFDVFGYNLDMMGLLAGTAVVEIGIGEDRTRVYLFPRGFCGNGRRSAGGVFANDGWCAAMRGCQAQPLKDGLEPAAGLGLIVCIAFLER